MFFLSLRSREPVRVGCCENKKGPHSCNRKRSNGFSILLCILPIFNAFFWERAKISAPWNRDEAYAAGALRGPHIAFGSGLHQRR